MNWILVIGFTGSSMVSIPMASEAYCQLAQTKVEREWPDAVTLCLKAANL